MLPSKGKKVRASLMSSGGTLQKSFLSVLPIESLVVVPLNMCPCLPAKLLWPQVFILTYTNHHLSSSSAYFRNLSCTGFSHHVNRQVFSKCHDLPAILHYRRFVDLACNLAHVFSSSTVHLQMVHSTSLLHPVRCPSSCSTCIQRRHPKQLYLRCCVTDAYGWVQISYPDCAGEERSQAHS